MTAMDEVIEDNQSQYLSQKLKEFELVTSNQNKIIEMLKKQSKYFEELSKENMDKTNTMLYKYRYSEQELNKMQNIIEKYERDVIRLRGEKENLVQQFNNSDSSSIESKKWKIKYEKILKKFESIENENKHLKDELEKFKKLLKEKQNENFVNGEMKSYQEELEEKLCNYQKELISASKEIQNLRQLGTESLKSLEHLCSENKRLKAENESLCKIKRNLSNCASVEIIEATKEIRELKQSVESALSREELKQKSLEELQKQNEWLRNEVERTRNAKEKYNDIDQMNEILMKKESEIESLARTVKIEIEEKNILLSDYLQSTEVLKDKLSVAQNLVEELTEEIREMKNNAEQNNIKKLKVRNEQLEKELEICRGQLEKLEWENAALKYDKAHLKINFHKVTEAYNNKNLLLDRIQEKLSTYQNSKGNFENIITDLETQNSELIQKINQMQQERDDIKNKLNESEINIKKVENKILQLNVSSTNVINDHDKLKQDFLLVSSKLKIVKTEYQNISQELDAYKDLYDNLTKMKAKDDKVIVNLKQENSQLRMEVSKMEIESLKAQKELDIRSKQIDDMTLQNEIQQIESQKFLKASKILQDTFHQLNDEIKNNCSRVQTLEKDIKNYKTVLNSFVSETKFLKDLPKKNPKKSPLNKLNNSLELKFVIHLLKTYGAEAGIEAYEELIKNKRHVNKELAKKFENFKRVQDIGISTELLNTFYENNSAIKCSNTLTVSAKNKSITQLSSRRSISVPNISKNKIQESDQNYMETTEANYLYKNENLVVSSKTICIKRCSSTSSVGFQQSEYVQHLDAERERWWSNMKTLHELRNQVQDIKCKLANTNKSSVEKNNFTSLKPNEKTSSDLRSIPDIVARFQTQVMGLFENWSRKADIEENSQDSLE